jgi:hypothetical protein
MLYGCQPAQNVTGRGHHLEALPPQSYLYQNPRRTAAFLCEYWYRVLVLVVKGGG